MLTRAFQVLIPSEVSCRRNRGRFDDLMRPLPALNFCEFFLYPKANLTLALEAGCPGVLCQIYLPAGPRRPWMYPQVFYKKALVLPPTHSSSRSSVLGSRTWVTLGAISGGKGSPSHSCLRRVLMALESAERSWQSSPQPIIYSCLSPACYLI